MDVEVAPVDQPSDVWNERLRSWTQLLTSDIAKLDEIMADAMQRMTPYLHEIGPITKLARWEQHRPSAAERSASTASTRVSHKFLNTL